MKKYMIKGKFLLSPDLIGNAKKYGNNIKKKPLVKGLYYSPIVEADLVKVLILKMNMLELFS
jgi:hypothetical protein